MPHEIRLVGDNVPKDDDVTLTLGAHPDGELLFEAGVATVDNEALARRLTKRYARLEHAGEVDVDDAEATDESDVDTPINPSEYTIDDLEAELDEEEYSAAELKAIKTAEEEGKDRGGATDVIETALEE